MPVDLLLDFGALRLRQFVQDRLAHHADTRDPRGCWKSTNSLNPEGYCSIRKFTNAQQQQRQAGNFQGPAGGTSIYLHRVAYTAHHGQNPPPGLQVSHLCDEPSCFNVQHLVVETGLRNRERKFCRGVISCPHHGYPAVVDFCTHTPKCMKPLPTPQQYTCCLQQHITSSGAASSVSNAQALSTNAAEALLSEDFSDRIDNHLMVEPSSSGRAVDGDTGEELPSLEELDVTVISSDTNIPSSSPAVTGSRRTASEAGLDEQPYTPRSRSDPSEVRTHVSNSISSPSELRASSSGETDSDTTPRQQEQEDMGQNSSGSEFAPTQAPENLSGSEGSSDS